MTDTPPHSPNPLGHSRLSHSPPTAPSARLRWSVRGCSVVVLLSILAALAFAGVAGAQPPDPCPPGTPAAGCDPATPGPGPGTQPGPPPPARLLPAAPVSVHSAGPGPAAPGAPAPGVPGAGPAAAGSCGIFDLNACIDGFFRWLVGSALNPLLDLVSTTLLTTPTIESLPRVAQLWDTSWQVLLGCYALLILVAGVVVMAYETLQTRYTIKEIAPRLVVGFLAGALSLWVAARGIDVANGLAAAIAGDDLDPASAGATLRAITQQSLTGRILILLMGLVLAVMLVVLLLTYVVRVALTVLLVAGAPLALMFHALPHTEGIARWWWKAFAAALAIQVGQSLALITALKVFLAPGGFTPFGTVTDNGLVNILVAIALVYVLVKIPFWMLSTIRGGGGGSLVGSLVRGVVAYKTFGLLGGGRRGGRGRAARLLARPWRLRPRRARRPVREGAGDSRRPVHAAAGRADPDTTTGARRADATDAAETPHRPGPATGAAAGRRLAGEQAGPRPRRPVPAAPRRYAPTPTRAGSHTAPSIRAAATDRAAAGADQARPVQHGIRRLSPRKHQIPYRR